jgi:hypothetical protein
MVTDLSPFSICATMNIFAVKFSAEENRGSAPAFISDKIIMRSRCDLNFFRKGWGNLLFTLREKLTPTVGRFPAAFI